jgi:hypothetical protein
MVQLQETPAFVQAGRAGDHHQRHLLGVCGGDGVQHVERARAVGHERGGRRRGDARGRVRREADGGLVAQRVQRQLAPRPGRLEQRQRKVARNAEQLLHAVIGQALQQCFRELHR